MPSFSYRALGRDGKEVRGVLQAESETAAVTGIRDNYPVLLSISEQADKKNASSILQMEIGNKQVKPKALSVLCSQFAITLRSGMSIARAMRMLAGQCTDKRLRKVMEEAAKEVAAGSTVAAALEKHQERFPLTFIETIRAGEQSGTLAQSFDRLHKFYDKSYKTTEKIRSALTYPMFVIAIAVVVVIVVMVKVFADLGGKLPLITRMMIGTSNFFARWWLLMFAVVVVAKLVYGSYTKTPKGRIWKAKMALTIPLIGPINQMNASVQFANTMSVLLAAGITLDRAVETTAKVMDNALFRDEIRSMKSMIEQGRTLSDCLVGKKYFPQTMVDMCGVGEETGELEETLDNVADYYANEAEYRVQRLLAALEPTLLILLAIFAGLIVISIYLPIFTMYDLM